MHALLHCPGELTRDATRDDTRGRDRVPDDAEQCPECQWPLDKTYDGPEYAYHWQDGDDIPAAARAGTGAWSAKVQYCLGDWCDTHIIWGRFCAFL